MLNKTISICLIVKNEEKDLPRCLNSIKEIADEIVIVDTGSTDNTIEIAKSFGAKVIKHPWKDDFSDARNKSIENATKDWIVFLDADEEITKEEGKNLKLIINDEKNDAKFEGYYLRLVNVIDGVEVGDSIVFRAFRNRPEYRFKGRMHEQIITSVENLKGPQSVGSTAVKILHYGYDPKFFDQLEKSKRNIGLLLSYKEEEKDGYYYYSLGNEYCRLGKFKEAQDCYDAAISYKEDKGNGVMPIYYAYLVVALTKMLHTQRKFKEELQYIEIFKRTCRDFKDNYFQEALIYIERASFSLAKKALQEHIRCSKIKFNYTYPDNNFDGYNIPDLMKQLEQAAIKHDKNLISSIILVDGNNDKVTETLKSLNEISKEVFLVVDNNCSLNLDEIINLGGNIIKTNLKDKNKAIMKAIRKCRGSYILKIEDGEIFSAEAQREIFKVLENNKKEIFITNIVTAEGFFINKEIRILKNTKFIKKLNSLEELKNNKLIEETSLNIHKVYKDFREVNKEMVGEYEGIKILIASYLDSDSKLLETALDGLKKLNEEIISLDYYFITNKKNKIIEDGIEYLEEYSDLVILEEEDFMNYEKILEYGKEYKYDYLILMDEKSNLNFEGLKELINNHNDITINKKINDDLSGMFLVLNDEALSSNISFDSLSVLGEKDKLFNLYLRAEVLGLNLKNIN